jgi:hypothetical protein
VGLIAEHINWPNSMSAAIIGCTVFAGGPARRETSTMPQWAGSCWYYLRFIDPSNPTALVDKQKEQYWMPVDLYVGGAEHAVLHLLYARFWHKVCVWGGVGLNGETGISQCGQGEACWGMGNRKSNDEEHTISVCLQAAIVLFAPSSPAHALIPPDTLCCMPQGLACIMDTLLIDEHSSLS